MPEEQVPDLYQLNLATIQIAHYQATMNHPVPRGGFMAILADIDAPLTRGIYKRFRRDVTPEQLDVILDEHREKLIADGKPPVLIAILPRAGVYSLLQELTQSEVMVQSGPGRRGASLMSKLGDAPRDDHFYTLIIGRTDEDGVVTLVKETATT